MSKSGTKKSTIKATKRHPSSKPSPKIENKITPDATDIVQDLTEFYKNETQNLPQKLSAIGYESATSIVESADRFAVYNEKGRTALNEWFNSTAIFIEAFNNISKELQGYSNALVNDNIEALKHIKDCKDQHDALHLQSDIIKANADATIQESIKLMEIGVEQAQSISHRINQHILGKTEELMAGLNRE